MRYYSSVAVESALTAGITASAATMPVSTVAGLPINYPYTLTIEPGDVAAEIVSVTAAAGTTLTVVRAQDGTAGVVHSVGAVVRHDHSARDFRESRDHEAATTAVHGVVGGVVGASNTQTLTNKTLTDTSNVFPTSLVTLAGAQALTNKNLAGAGNTFPTSLVTETGGQALTNKVLDSSNVFPMDLLVTLTGVQTLTWKNLASSTNVFPASLVTLTAAQTLTNKNLAGVGNVFPTTLATLSGVQTLTNKTLTNPVINDGGVILPQVQAGKAAVATVSAGRASVTVTFPTAFTSAPKVTVSPITSSPEVVSIAHTEATTTQVVVTVYRVSGSGSVDFDWIAVA